MESSSISLLNQILKTSSMYYNSISNKVCSIKNGFTRISGLSKSGNSSLGVMQNRSGNGWTSPVVNIEMQRVFVIWIVTQEDNTSF